MITIPVQYVWYQYRYIEKKFCLFSRNNLTIKKLRFFLQTNYFKNLFSPL